MEFMQYNRGTSFEGNGTTAEISNETRDMSVEDLVLSMRQDLFVDDSGIENSTGSNDDSYGCGMTSVHVQPGAVSVRTNAGVGNKQIREEIADIEVRQSLSQHRSTEDSSIMESGKHYAPTEKYYVQHDDNRNITNGSHRSTSSHHQQQQQKQQYDPQQQQQLQQDHHHHHHLHRHQQQPQYQQRTLSNEQAQPQLASQFYQQLRMSWGPTSKQNDFTSQPTSDPSHPPSPGYAVPDSDPDLSPRMLPKPPQEPHRGSRTRSSLRRAANLLLNRSRLSLSDGETTRKPTPPRSPRSNDDDSIDSQRQRTSKAPSIRERLQKNRSKMGDLMRSQNHSRARRASQDNIDPGSSPSEMQPYRTTDRKYASADNLGHIVCEDSRPLSSLYGGKHLSVADSSPRTPSPGYKLRRHNSGPVYQEANKELNNHHHRGYHTADSDSDCSMVNGRSMHNQPRNESYKAMPSTRDTLHALQKKHDVTTPTTSRHMRKSVSGPLKADHSIHLVRSSDERSPRDLSESWVEQGARPKHSIESNETEDVKHEIFHDTPIGMRLDPSRDHRRNESRTSRDVDVERNNGRGGSSRNSRPASPSRSVHFEDGDSSPISESDSRRLGSRSGSRGRRCDDAENREASWQADEQYAPIKNNGHTREDPYATIADGTARIFADENPYEEVHFQEHKVRRPAGDTPATDSELYAKVDKKRHRKKKGHEVGKEVDAVDGVEPSPLIGTTAGNEPIYAQVDKTKKKPPTGSGRKHHTRNRTQSDASVISNGNPCATEAFDDSISQVGSEVFDRSKSNLHHMSDISGSQSSITSRASISDRMQSFGRATRKRLGSIKRTLSFDKMDKVGRGGDEDKPQLKRSPSLRSLTSLFSKKDKSQDGLEPSGKLNKRRSASMSGLYVRPQRSSQETDVTVPSHMRKVGKLLRLNSDGSQVVQLIKPPAGPFGFYIAKGTSNFGSGYFVTRLGDGHPAKFLAGLLAVGDEILEINGIDIRTHTLDDVYDMLMDNDKLVLRLVPIASRSSMLNA